MNDNNNWFASWFDSPHYHILYKNRDHKEAEFFLKNLTDYLKPREEDKILDLACGAGRHSIFLNKLGYDVTGVDLSPNSIKKASESGNERLHFDTHDMREVYKENGFDFVFNMFTSFGYFNSEKENVKVLRSIEKTLKPQGKFVLDFFNSEKVIKELIPEETKEIEGVKFNLKRTLIDGQIVKDIQFSHENRTFTFQEKVEAINLNQFKALFSKTNLKIITTFGDYSLNEFNPIHSDRLIIVARN